MNTECRNGDAIDALCYMVTEVWKSGKSQRINLNDYLGFDWKTDRDVWNVCNNLLLHVAHQRNVCKQFYHHY